MIASHPNKLNPSPLASPIRLVKAHNKAATAGELWLINRVLNFSEQVLRQLDLLDTFLVCYDIYARVRFIFVKFNTFWGEAVWGTRYTKWLYAHLALEWDIYYEFRAEVWLSPQAIISHMLRSIIIWSDDGLNAVLPLIEALNLRHVNLKVQIIRICIQHQMLISTVAPTTLQMLKRVNHLS